MNFRRSARSDREVRRFVLECDALLSGRSLEVYEWHRVPAPAWAQLNWIAHCEPSEILYRSQSELGLQRQGGTWPWAISTMAHEMVKRAGGCEAAIRRLQRECLIPLELTLLRNAPASFLP